MKNDPYKEKSDVEEDCVEESDAESDVEEDYVEESDAESDVEEDYVEEDPIVVAAQDNNLQDLKKLINAKINGAFGDEISNALEIAIINKHKYIVEYLLETFTNLCSQKTILKSLELAIYSGAHFLIIDTLITYANNNGNFFEEALIIGAIGFHLATVNKLLYMYRYSNDNINNALKLVAIQSGRNGCNITKALLGTGQCSNDAIDQALIAAASSKGYQNKNITKALLRTGQYSNDAINKALISAASSNGYEEDTIKLLLETRKCSDDAILKVIRNVNDVYKEPLLKCISKHCYISKKYFEVNKELESMIDQEYNKKITTEKYDGEKVEAQEAHATQLNITSYIVIYNWQIANDRISDFIEASLCEIRPFFSGFSSGISHSMLVLYIIQGYLDQFSYGNLLVAARSLKSESTKTSESTKNSDAKKKNEALIIKKDGECKKDKLNKNPEDDTDDDEKEGGDANDSNGKYNGNSTSKQIDKDGLAYKVGQDGEKIYKMEEDLGSNAVSCKVNFCFSVTIELPLTQVVQTVAEYNADFSDEMNYPINNYGVNVDQLFLEMS